ncbi:MAG: helix-turn-helix domain-containing protein, partial [Terriglobales bacterium]
EEITPAQLQIQAARGAMLPSGADLGLPEGFHWEGTLVEVADRAARIAEGALLLRTLQECKWNKAKTADRLGISYKTLLAKIHTHSLNQ